MHCTQEVLINSLGRVGETEDQAQDLIVRVAELQRELKCPNKAVSVLVE